MTTDIRESEYTDSRLPGWTFFRAGGGAWIGEHGALRLTACGESRSEAQEMAAEAVELLTADIAETLGVSSVLPSTLREAGGPSSPTATLKPSCGGGP